MKITLETRRVRFIFELCALAATAYYKEHSPGYQVIPPEGSQPCASLPEKNDNEVSMHSRLSRGFWTLLCLLAIPALAQNQEPAHRLILKDGSYQLVTKYEVKEDRVRYYSTEREEWEELPNSLVDWPATNKYESDRVAHASAPEAVQLDKELEHEDELKESRLPQVAPGLRIPEESGVFLLETFQGVPQLIEVHQAEGDINRDTKGNIFHGAVNPIAGLKVTLELDGAHAAIQSHVDVPALYIKPEESADEAQAAASQSPAPLAPTDRFRVVHIDVKGNKRIIGDIKRQVTGKISQEQHFVKTTVTKVSGGWVKITPTESLSPGEYCLVEMMGKEGMNLYVWDFGVNPKAGANPNPWKPEVKSDAPKASQPPQADQPQ